VSDRWEKLEVSNVTGGPRGLGMVSRMMAQGEGEGEGEGSVRRRGRCVLAGCYELVAVSRRAVRWV
jgi:hypothetical protein